MHAQSKNTHDYSQHTTRTHSPVNPGPLTCRQVPGQAGIPVRVKQRRAAGEAPRHRGQHAGRALCQPGDDVAPKPGVALLPEAPVREAAHAAPAPEASSSSGQSRPRAAGKAASSVAQQHPAPSAQHPPGQQRVIRGHGNQLERAQQRVMSQGVGQRRRVQHRAVRVCSAAHGGSQGAGSHEGTAGLGKASMSSPPRNPFSLPCTHPAPGFQS